MMNTSAVFTPMPLHVPTAEELSMLSPLDPMLMHLIFKDMMSAPSIDGTYEGSELLNVLSDLDPPPAGSSESEEAFAKRMVQHRRDADPFAWYKRYGTDLVRYQTAPNTVNLLASHTPKRPAFMSALSNFAIAERDRLVRYSPSANVYFAEALIDGMVSAVSESSPNSINDMEASSGQLPGVLSRAPAGLVSSPSDAISGNWNMSDLPPWLTIPAFVNVANCLNPTNEVHVPPDYSSKRNKSSVSSGAFHSSDSPFSLSSPGSHQQQMPPSAPRYYAETDEMYEPQRRILIIGSSHGGDVYRSLCELLGLHMWNRGLRQGGNKMNQWPRTFTEANPIPSCTRLVRFIAVHNRYLSQFESGLRRMLSKVPADSHPTPPLNPHPRNLSDHQNPIVREYSNVLPKFAERFGTETSSLPPFQYSDYLLNFTREEIARLRGLFTHVIVVPGAWELLYVDATIAEHTQNMAIFFDLIQEVLQPQKIILHNLRTRHPRSKATPIPFVGQCLRRLQNAVPLQGRKGSRKCGPYSPVTKPSTHCFDRYRAAKFRDAHLSAVDANTRDKVRRAFGARYLQLNGISDEKAIRSYDFSLERAPTEVFDIWPMTDSQLGMLKMDEAGHHVRGTQRYQITHRLLRDHVCPPKYVMAIHPSSAPSIAVPGGKPHRMTTAAPTEDMSYRPYVNYAGSTLPREFPFMAGHKVAFIRVRQTADSTNRMPTLVTSTSDSLNGKTKVSSYEIRDLFPTHKLPLPVVSEGLRRAIFDHPYTRLSGDKESGLVRNESVSVSMRRSAKGEKNTSSPSPWFSTLQPLSLKQTVSPPAHMMGPIREAFPLVDHVSAGTTHLHNPFVACIHCNPFTTRRTVSETEKHHAECQIKQFHRRVPDAANASRMLFSPGSEVNRRVSLSVYRAPRYNDDPLFLLRTTQATSIDDQLGINMRPFPGMYPVIAIDAPQGHQLVVATSPPRRFWEESICEGIFRRISVGAYLRNATRIRTRLLPKSGVPVGMAPRHNASYF